jgi:hypothetical protein
MVVYCSSLTIVTLSVGLHREFYEGSLLGARKTLVRGRDFFLLRGPGRGVLPDPGSG